MSSDIGDMAAADVRIGSAWPTISVLVLASCALAVLLFDAWHKRSQLFPGQFGQASSVQVVATTDSVTQANGQEVLPTASPLVDADDQTEESVADGAVSTDSVEKPTDSVELISERAPSAATDPVAELQPVADEAVVGDSNDAVPNFNGAADSETGGLSTDIEVVLTPEAESLVEDRAPALPLAAGDRDDGIDELRARLAEAESEAEVSTAAGEPVDMAEAASDQTPNLEDTFIGESGLVADTSYQLQGADQLMAESADLPADVMVVSRAAGEIGDELQPLSAPDDSNGAGDSDWPDDADGDYPVSQEEQVADSDATPVDTRQATSDAADPLPEPIDDDSDAEVVFPTPEPVASGSPADSDSTRSATLSPFERERQRELARLGGLSQQIRFPQFSVAAGNDTLKALDSVFEILFLYSETRVIVSARTNEYNSDSSNQVLSRERAQTIINYLSLRGLDAERFSTAVASGSDLARDAHEVLISATVVTE